MADDEYSLEKGDIKRSNDPKGKHKHTPNNLKRHNKKSKEKVVVDNLGLSISDLMSTPNTFRPHDLTSREINADNVSLLSFEEKSEVDDDFGDDDDDDDFEEEEEEDDEEFDHEYKSKMPLETTDYPFKFSKNN